jgi:dsDNA-binding SOS-regulon protein
MFWRRLLSSVALALLLIAPAGGQTPEERTTLNEQEKQQKALELKKELERKTFLLLDEIVTSAPTLKLPENRALVQSSAADLLWTRDEKRARALFREALDNLREAAPKQSGKMSDEQRRAYQMWLQQRKEVLQIVARRDADYALELLRATRSQIPQGQTASLLQPNEEDRLEQSLAIQVATSDPKRALALAEENLSKGLSFELLNLLSQLNSKDKDLARQLATDIIGKLRSENLARNPEAAWLAVVFLRMSARSEESETYFLSNASVGGGKPYTLDERQLRDLLEVVTGAALADASNDAVLTFLQQLMPEVEKYLPERVPALRHRLAASSRKLDPRERVYFEYQELLQRGTIEALLEAAAKAPEQMRDALYEQAAWKALYKEKDSERARQIINDTIRDPSKRERMLEDLDRVSMWEATRKQKLDEARRILARLKSKDERAGALVQMAYMAATRKDKKLALQLLEEARPLVSPKPKSDAQLYTLLQIARVYALVEPPRAFEMIESLVDQANNLLSAASVLSGFLLPSGVFKKGEMVLPPGYSNVSVQFRQFGKELGALALLSFERTKAAADKFQRNEARIMARLFIVQGVLSQQLGSGVALYEGGVVVGH